MTQIPLARRSPVQPDACNLAKAIDVVLSGRLKKLVDDGLLAKRAYKSPGKRSRPEYVLSPMGLSLRPILIGLTQWGDAWLGKGETPPISFTKAGSKSAIRAAFVDIEGREVRPDQIRPVLRG